MERARVGVALIGIFVSALAAGVLGTLVAVLARPSEQAYFDLGLLIAVPALAALTTLSWLAFTAGAFVIGRWLGGTGRFGSLAACFAACSVPLMIAASVLSAFPVLAWVSLALYLYWLALFVVAVGAVHRVAAWRALVAVVTAVVALGVLYGALLLGLTLLNRSLT